MIPFFTEVLRNTCLKPFRIREDDIASVISNPEQRQGIRLADGEEFGLFASGVRSMREESVLLVWGKPSGDVLTVEVAFKIPGHIAGPAGNRKPPLDMLEGIAEAFGFDVQIGDVRRKFFLSETIRLSKQFKPVEVVKVLNNGAACMLRQMVRTLPDGGGMSVECAICFALNTNRYKRAIGA